jgi:hypothetical protein
MGDGQHGARRGSLRIVALRAALAHFAGFLETSLRAADARKP